MDDKERLRIVIMQMLEHNDVHLKEYEKWARFAETNHMTDAGGLLDKAGKYAEFSKCCLKADPQPFISRRARRGLRERHVTFFENQKLCALSILKQTKRAGENKYFTEL